MTSHHVAQLTAIQPVALALWRPPSGFGAPLPVALPRRNGPSLLCVRARIVGGARRLSASGHRAGWSISREVLKDVGARGGNSAGKDPTAFSAAARG